MASLTIRSLDDRLKSLLRLEAARHGRSMEEEVRQILRSAVLGANTERNGAMLAEQIKSRFSGLHADEIALAPRQTPRIPPNWNPEA